MQGTADPTTATTPHRRKRLKIAVRRSWPLYLLMMRDHRKNRCAKHPIQMTCVRPARLRGGGHTIHERTRHTASGRASRQTADLRHAKQHRRCDHIQHANDPVHGDSTEGSSVTLVPRAQQHSPRCHSRPYPSGEAKKPIRRPHATMLASMLASRALPCLHGQHLARHPRPSAPSSLAVDPR